MTGPVDELSRLLRETDPIPREGNLPRGEVAAMRARVMASAPTSVAYSGWPIAPALALAAVVMLAVVGTMFDSRSERGTERASSSVAVHMTRPEAAQPRTQVQFETPGGTRIVWVLNPDLDF